MSRDKNQWKDYLLILLFFVFIDILLYVPVVNIIALLLLPLPFIILSTKRDGVPFILLLITNGVLLFLYPTAILLYMTMIAMIIGGIMGQMYRHPLAKGTEVVLSGFIAGVISVWFFLFLGQVFFQMVTRLQAAWIKNWDVIQSQMKVQGLLIKEAPAPPLEMMLPSILFFALGMAVLLNLALSRQWLGGRGFPGKYLPKFRDWRLPRIFFYFYMLSFLYTWLVHPNDESTVNYALLGVLVVLHLLFFIQGLAFVRFVMHHKKIRKTWFLLVVILIMTPLSILIEIMGIIDTGTRLRQRIVPKR